ncbi:serine protease [uncultured Roseobacter sp.]|uniref:serine protease n=1 Tax=uncultured Roseobacter sp. TaxID=114847 RepID=UPI002604A354|nr:serine protease [uncultured Roseobacter sp.]
MLRYVIVLAVLVLAPLQTAQAQGSQDVVWVQIAARPSLAEAVDQAAEFARALEDVAGFDMGRGWFAIALGPYTREDAEQVLQVYRRDGLIPRDSYIAQNGAYRGQFWPVQGAQTGDTAGTSLQTTTETPAAPPAEPAIVVPEAPQQAQEEAGTPDPETRADALRSERALTREERRELQIALQDGGYYSGGIDGAFGRGTRASMAAWQRANDVPDTGVLTTRQRAKLMAQYNAILDGLGMQTVRDATAGIAVRLPTSVVRFDRYEAPFAHYRARDEGGPVVLLISQPGDRDTLAGLYAVMQTLSIVPLQGDRALARDSFSLVGRNDRIVSETRVSLQSGEIKGFTLIWPADDEVRRARLITEMNRSLTRLPGVMDPATGTTLSQDADLVSGLAVRKPRASRSGFFVTQRGAVMTTSDVVENCARITLDGDLDAELSLVDADRGIALITPGEALAPLHVANFSPVPPQLSSEIAVAGYSYEGTLNAPSVTFGSLADLGGLAGEPTLNRLTIPALTGDEGGPVMDASGNVFGMLLPRPDSNRQLPDDVQFSLSPSALSDFATRAGIDVTYSARADALAPEDIATRGVDMTVLVSCWE